MTASATQPPPPTVKNGGNPTSAQPVVDQRAGTTTPAGTRRFLDRWLWRLPLVLSLMAAACVALTFLAQQSARSVADNAAPALIDLQDLLGNVAEANAAATSAHLSIRAEGVEDRASRGLYESAVDRALAETISIAATGVSFDGVDEVASSVADYRAEIEAARVANLNGLDNSDSLLLGALSSVDAEVRPAVSQLSNRGQTQIDDRVADATVFLVGALACAAVALVVMVLMQRSLAYRTRRILNRYLLVASVAVVAIIALLGWALYVRSVLLSDAIAGGYNAVTATGELQSEAFALQSSLSVLLLDETQSATGQDEIATLIEQVDVSTAAVNGRADSARELAAADALTIRWERYRATVDGIVGSARQGDTDAAVGQLRGQALSDFNGFNTAIESVLLDNRVQFLDGARRARQVVDYLPWIVLALGVLAALLSVAGVQQRRQDYQ